MDRIILQFRNQRAEAEDDLQVKHDTGKVVSSIFPRVVVPIVIFQNLFKVPFLLKHLSHLQKLKIKLL